MSSLSHLVLCYDVSRRRRENKWSILAPSVAIFVKYYLILLDKMHVKS